MEDAKPGERIEDAANDAASVAEVDDNGTGGRTPRPAGRLWRAILPLVILAAAVGVALVLVRTRPEIVRKPVPERVWTISATTVAIADVQPELKLLGEIVAGRSVELRPLVGGRVVEVGQNYVEGGTVRRGELLVAIDRFDYEAALKERAAQLLEAEARLTELKAERTGEAALLQQDLEQLILAKREAKRRADLRQRGTGSQKALDDARRELAETQQRVIARNQMIERLAARVDQQEAVIAQRNVAVARAGRDLENTRLVAPFDAYVTDRGTAIGKQVGVGDKVARLIDAGWFEARFHVSDAEFARMVASGGIEGRAAQVIWRTRAKDFAFDARIERAASEVDPTSGGVELYARLRGIEIGAVLRPGVFVEVLVPDRNYARVARLPDSALIGGDTVYVVKDGRLEPRRVELVARAGNDVLLRGELRSGDVVATTAFAEIGPGVKVELRRK